MVTALPVAVFLLILLAKRTSCRIVIECMYIFPQWKSSINVFLLLYLQCFEFTFALNSLPGSILASYADTLVILWERSVPGAYHFPKGTSWDVHWIMVRDFPKSANQPKEMALTICNWPCSKPAGDWVLIFNIDWIKKWALSSERASKH